MRVEVLSSVGCPNAGAAGALVRGCLRELGLDVPVQEEVARSPHRRCWWTGSTS